MATQYPVRLEGEFVIQRTTPLPCRCISPAPDLAGVGELPESSLYAVECWERFGKCFTQSKQLLRGEWRSLQTAKDVYVTLCDRDPAFGASACHVGTL